MEILGAAATAKSLNSRLGDGLRLHSRWLLTYVFAVALGALGDLASCTLAPLSVFWAQIMPQLNYIGIVFAATRFGAGGGLASACVAAISHTTVITMTCSQAGSERGHLAMFAAIGLMAGLIANRRSQPSRKAEPTTVGPEERGRNVPLSELGRMMPELVHQFRTPIASIEGAGFVLEDADLSEDKRQEFVAIIRKECRRLEHLVQLLDFTQSGISIDQEVDITRLLDDVIGLCRPKTDRGIIFRNTARRDLPKLRYDPRLIRQAVHALTTNAILAIPRNGELELSADLAPGEIVIRVNACAEPFDSPFDADVTHRRSSIDLAFIQEILRRHGGSIRVEPSTRGSITFSMILPCESR